MYAAVSHEQLICGLHVHAEIEDRDLAARAMSWITPWTSLLMALSASSPFWAGLDTGYASWRTMLWQRWPSAGPPGPFVSAADYDRQVEALIRSGVILDAGMNYQDLRLSAHVPTIELRVCDSTPDVRVCILVAALFRALVRCACRAADAGEAAPPTMPSALRAATWQAARTGMHGCLVDPVAMAPVPALRLLRRLIDELRGDLDYFGDLPLVLGLAGRLTHTDSARRQRRVAADAGPRGVVDQLVHETGTHVALDGLGAFGSRSALDHPGAVGVDLDGSGSTRSGGTGSRGAGPGGVGSGRAGPAQRGPARRG